MNYFIIVAFFTLIIIIQLMVATTMPSSASPIFETDDASYTKIDPLSTQTPRQIVYNPHRKYFVIVVTGSNKIYKFEPDTAIFTHVAGTGAVGASNALLGVDATFNAPTGVTMFYGRLGTPTRGYLFSDTGNNCIRKTRPNFEVQPFCASVCDGTGASKGSTVGQCGSAPTPKYNAPAGMDFHNGDRVIFVIADQGSHTVTIMFYPSLASNLMRKELLAGTVDTPGSADGAALSATFNEPFAVAIFPRAASNPTALFISEHGAARLRRLRGVSDSGTVSTIFDHGASNKGWGLDHRSDGTASGVLLWWNDFNGLYYFNMTVADAALVPASSISSELVGFKCGENKTIWPSTFANFSIFAMRNSSTTDATDYDMLMFGTCPTSTTTTTTTATTTIAAPENNAVNDLPPSSDILNALVVSVPSCPSSLNSKCQIRHPQSNECRCPQNTFEQNITLLPSFAFLPSTSATSQLIDQVGNPCVRNEFILGICTASTSERYIAAFVRSGGTTSENGICEQANPFTNDCSCRVPSTKASFAIATGSSATFAKRFVTFCLPPNGDLSVFWTIHPDVATSTANRAQTSCVSPNGNVTCECTAGASKTTFAASIFPPDSTSTDPVPGDLTFCKAKPAEPEEEVNFPITITGTAVGIVGGFIEGGGANAVVGMQVAALLMTLCDNNPNVSTNGAKSVVVFFQYPGVDPSLGGLAFMLTLTLGVFVLHLLVCVLLGFKRFIFTEPIEFDPDRIDFFEEEIDDPSCLEQIRFVSLQLRFPHWSFFVMNVGFSGVVVESAILLQNTEDDINVVIGAIGLVLTIIYIILTLYYSYWGLRSVAPQKLFDIVESDQLHKMKKDKKKLKRELQKAEADETLDDLGGDYDAVLPPRSSRSSRHRRQGRSAGKVFSDGDSHHSGSNNSSSSSASSSDTEEEGHKWFSRRKSIQPPSSSLAKRRSITQNKPNSRRRSSTLQILNEEEEEVENNEIQTSASALSSDQQQSSALQMPSDNDNDDAAAVEGGEMTEEGSPKESLPNQSVNENPLRAAPQSVDDDLHDTKDEEEEGEDSFKPSSKEDVILTEEDKPPHYVKYGKAIQMFAKYCGAAKYFLSDGWWIKFRLYNRRYASIYNSFQPRPTAWAPTIVRVFMFSVSIASSLGGCIIPLTYAGTVALLVAIFFLGSRPCRRPFDNFLLALQLILAATLAFSRSSDPELSVNLFYGVIAVTFVYVFHICLMEALESFSMSALELNAREQVDQNEGGSLEN